MARISCSFCRWEEEMVHFESSWPPPSASVGKITECPLCDTSLYPRDMKEDD